MYELKVEETFAAAHNLRGYQGKCEGLHGHNWKIEVAVRADRLDETGLAIDFRDLKQATCEIIESLDHAYLNELPAFREDNPSSELIAKYIFDELSNKLDRNGLWVARVTAWESEKACASYLKD